MQDRTKQPARRPGRPRLFDADDALENAMQLFWSRGFAATSLDDLAVAMDMNRPSMANAFGDKEAIFRRALARFVAQLDLKVGRPLSDEPDLAKGLERFFTQALSVYFSADAARGCMVFCTAPVEAVTRPEVRADAKRVVRALDDLLEKRFARAQKDGAFPRDADCRAAAQLTQAILQSLAVRARSGASKASLTKLARQAVRVLVAAGDALH